MPENDKKMISPEFKSSIKKLNEFLEFYSINELHQKIWEVAYFSIGNKDFDHVPFDERRDTLYFFKQLDDLIPALEILANNIQYLPMQNKVGCVSNF